MSQPPSEGAEHKSRRPRVSKATRGQDTKSKTKISVYVSLDSARRLGIHATMTGQDRSTVVDMLIREHLRDWVVQYRPSSKNTETSEETDSEAGADAS